MDSINSTRSCSLKLGPDLRDKDHAFFVRLLLRSAVEPSDIQQIDLKGRRGFCKITLATRAALERLLAQVIHVNGSQLNFIVGDGSVILLHVYGVDEDLPLKNIVGALQQFGSVIGQPRREQKSCEGCTFHTGTVFVQFVPKAAVPSTLHVGDAAKLRVWHVGQVQTCFKCGSTDHQAKDCTSEMKSLYSAKVSGSEMDWNVDKLISAARQTSELQHAPNSRAGTGLSVKGSEVTPLSTASDAKDTSQAVSQNPADVALDAGASSVVGSTPPGPVSPSASTECMPSISASNSMDNLTGHECYDDGEGNFQVHSNKRHHRSARDSQVSSQESSPANGKGKKLKAR